MGSVAHDIDLFLYLFIYILQKICELFFLKIKTLFKM